jgi:Zn-dependent protease with chaperone function
MSAPCAAELFDGVTASRHAVEVRADADALVLHGVDAAEASVVWSALVRIDNLPDAILLGRTDRPGWRLKLPPDAPSAILDHVARQSRFGRLIDRFGYLKSLACCALVSGMVVAAVFNASTWLAPHIPVAWENGMSDDAIGSLADNTCHTPASDAALAGLVAQLDRDAAAQHLPPVHLELLKLDQVNAVALPGGRVLVFDGLLHQISSPDALAGVIGHEIGHVRLHHVMQAVLRQYGISLVLGGYRSSVTNAMGQLTALRFTREAEADADAWSRARLDATNTSPLPTAGFLAALEPDTEDPQSGMAAFLASHPDPLARAISFRAAFDPARTYRPALDHRAFSAIVNACADDVKAKPWTPFQG